MQRLTGAVLYIAGGALAGVASAYAMIQTAGVTGFGNEGPWYARAAEQDSIYAQSYYLLAGRLPAAPGQLSEAMAERDSEGQALSSACAYVLTSSGTLPRWWSLSALSASAAAPSRQSVVDAATAVREADGTVRVTAAKDPQPGNWLKLPQARQFTFLLLATPGASKPAGRIPALRIERKGC